MAQSKLVGLVLLGACCLHPAGGAVDAGPGDGGLLSDAGASDAGRLDGGSDAGFDADAGLCSGLSVSGTVPTFGAAIPLQGNADYNYDLAVGDIDGDGIPDLLQSNMSSYFGGPGFLGVYLGLPDGGFSAPRSYGAAFFAAVVDPDGGAAVGSVGDGGPSIYLWSDDGRALATLPTTSSQFAVVDLDGDGRPDIVNCFYAGVETLLNSGNAIFKTPRPISSLSCQAIAAGDLDLDGVPDLVIVGYANSLISVLVGDLDGGFSTSTNATGSPGLGSKIVLQDLNGDGLPDIVAVGVPGFYVMLNRGGGKFNSPTSYTAGECPAHLAVADLNGDCWPDIVVSGSRDCPGPGDATVYLFLNRGDGTFSSAIQVDSGLVTGASGIALYKGSGAVLPSIAVAGSVSGQLEILPNLTRP